MESFDVNQVGSLTDAKSLSFLEPMFYVLGNGLRMLMLVTGFIDERMDQRKLAENTRTLLCHYKRELTGNEPHGRVITETLSNHLVNEWVRLVNFVSIPGRINKSDIGDIINNIMIHLDGEILPTGNEVVRNLQCLKMKLCESSTVTNGEILQTLFKTTGLALANDYSTGRTMNKKGVVRNDVGEHFNYWMGTFCHKFPERAVVDLRLESDRHRVSSWSDMFDMEAKRKGNLS